MAKDPFKESGPRIGVDENGLGPRLGPLVVTAAFAQVSEAGVAQLQRKLPKKIRADLDDSKVLVSCHDASLGEAWARSIVERMGQRPESPRQLLAHLCAESEASLTSHCPKSTQPQCWHVAGEAFTATDEQLDRVRGHLEALNERGIDVQRVACDLTCTGRLNQLKESGVHRFAADLHAMERLILELREQAQVPILATCGKVGGIGKYEPFFGPLSGRLHTPLSEGQASSSYYFPQLGTIRFVRDADASDALVMLASLVGKYVRELLMNRISRFYQEVMKDPDLRPSGYHDPVTTRFVEESAAVRKKLKIVTDCFERRPATA
jgi:ribonuclease HII